MKRLGDHQISRIALSRRQLLGGLAGLAAAASSTAQAAPLFRPSQLNHLTLNVSDLERSRAFYRNLFGGPQWTVSPATESFDLGANPLGIYIQVNPRGTPVGIDHFCIGLRDFNDDTALSTLKQQSMDAEKAVNGVGIQFRDLDGIKVELVPENYRNPRAEPQKGPQPPVQSLFRPVGLNHVTLQVADLERATKFYESLFGPSFHQRARSFRLGMGQLALINYGVNPVGVDHFCVSVEGYEADAVSEKLKQNGIPSQRLYEPNQVFVRDPDGILVQLAGPDYGNR